jgi:hypothetical protein
MDRILSKYLDKEFTDVAEKALRDYGIVILYLMKKLPDLKVRMEKFQKY